MAQVLPARPNFDWLKKTAKRRLAHLRAMIVRTPSLLAARMTRNQHRRTPLHHAAAKNRPRTVRLLLELGADANATDASAATALTTAAQENADVAIINDLLAGEQGSTS
jgi:hypothetical protein